MFSEVKKTIFVKMFLIVMVIVVYATDFSQQSATDLNFTFCKIHILFYIFTMFLQSINNFFYDQVLGLGIT